MTGRIIGPVKLPYPVPTSAAASAAMRSNRKKDTRPELAIRSALHRRGVRFRLGGVVRTDTLRVAPDLVFRRARLAVFVDGCWWHRCPEHANEPRANTAYWLPKLDRNVTRDRLVDDGLRAAGWTVIRVWEHEDAIAAARLVADELARKAATPKAGLVGR
jgi:DNA mismatch endonuclease, patch repair protein